MNRILFLVLLLSSCASCAQPAAFDLVIRHGTVIDGSGNPRFDADVGDPQRLHRGDRRPAGGAAPARDRGARALRRARIHQHPQPRVARCAADRREHADAGRDDGDLQRRRQRAARHRAADEDAWPTPGSPSNIGGYIGFNSRVAGGGRQHRSASDPGGDPAHARDDHRAASIRARGACRPGSTTSRAISRAPRK